MHLCLRIDEVLRAIAYEVFSDGRLEIENSFENILHMALTCRAFYEPAMDELWDHTYCTRPLFKCLPEDTWKIVAIGEIDPRHDRPNGHNVMTITRIPFSHEWSRFVHHARRITFLRLEHGEDDDQGDVIHPICWSIVEEFAKWSGTSLFPRLRKLDISLSRGIHPAFSVLFGSALHYIEGLPDDRHTLLQVLDLIRERSRGLQHINFSPLYSLMDDVTEPLSRTLCSLNKLRSLEVPYPELNNMALSHLSRLLQLHALYITISTGNRQISSSQGSMFFPALRVLKVKCAPQAIGVSTRFLSLVSARLEALQIWVTGRGNTAALPSLFDAVSHFDSLLGLAVQYESDYVRPGISTRTGPFTPLNSNVLFPLRTLRELHYLELRNVPIDFQRHNQDVYVLAEAWKALSSLFVVWDSFTQPYEAMMCLSLEDLVAFARLCPALHQVHVTLHPILADWTCPTVPDNPSFASIIDWQGSYIDAAAIQEVTSFFATVFPMAELRSHNRLTPFEGVIAQPETWPSVAPHIHGARELLLAQSIETLRTTHDVTCKRFPSGTCRRREWAMYEAGSGFHDVHQCSS